jgi:hypothetical protein
MNSITKDETALVFNLLEAYASKGVFLIVEYETIFNVYKKIKDHIDATPKNDLELDQTITIHIRNIIKLCSQRTGTDIDSWRGIMAVYDKITSFLEEKKITEL